MTSDGSGSPPVYPSESPSASEPGVPPVHPSPPPDQVASETEPPHRKKQPKGIWVAIVAALAAIGKYFAVIWKFLLPIVKFAKAGKILLTGGTMLLSVGAYDLIFGWKFAVGFVICIFIHEMGHVGDTRRHSGADKGAARGASYIALVALAHFKSRCSPIYVRGLVSSSFHQI